MQSRSSEFFLDSEDYWKHRFKVTFIRLNDDGSEWWTVTNIDNKHVVSCNSMLAAFKIAYIAEEKLDIGYVDAKVHSSLKHKAGELLYNNHKCKQEWEISYNAHMMAGDRYYDGAWHPVKRK